MAQQHVKIEWQPLKSKRASEDIYEQLRGLITSGVLKPGDRLPSERTMMAELNRSRPTIREALRMLEQGGYISSIHGASGAIVQELSIEDVEQPLVDMIQLNQITLGELNEYRQSNDSTIAAWAAKRRTDADLSALHACMEQAQQCLSDYEKFVALDVRFHSLLAQATGNQVAMIVTQVLGSVETETLRKKMQAISPENRRALSERILQRHGVILEAIEKRDSRAARAAMREHTHAAGKDLKI